MNAVQSNAGKGDSATFPEQTATTATQAAQIGLKIPLSPDERKAAFTYAQGQLLDLVDNFMFEETVSGPIELLNDLLYHWLTTPAIDDVLPNMANQENRNQLDKAFRLVNFLAKAYELQVGIDFVNHKTGEASHE